MKVACLTFRTFYAYKVHLNESRLFMLFMLIKFSRKKKKIVLITSFTILLTFRTFYVYKVHLSESRLFMLFMLIKFSCKKNKNSPNNLVYYTTQLSCFPLNFAKFLRAPILTNICERLLLRVLKPTSCH